MLFSYIVILLVVFVFAMPLASKKIVYGYNPARFKEYDTLELFGSSQRRVLIAMLVLLGIVLVAFCINKEEDIADNAMYMAYYNAGGQVNSGKEMEPAFPFITHISPSYAWLLGIFATLSVGTHLLGVAKNSPNLWLTLLLYIVFPFVLHDVIQIRAAVAAGVFTYAFRFAFERKWWIYFPLIAACMLFHYSAVVFLPLYFLPRKNLNKPFWIILTLVVLAMGFAGIHMGMLSRYIPLGIVENYVEAYLGSREHTSSANGFYRVFLCLLIVVMIMRIDVIKKHYPFAVYLLPVYIFSQSAYLLFGDIAVLQSRVGELFGVVEIFVIAMFPMISRKHYYLLMSVPLLVIIHNIITAISLFP